MEIHDKIRTMREINQWTQKDMAEKLDLSITGYSKIERGKTRLNLDKLEQIAKIFNIDVVELINSKENTMFFLIGDNNNNNANYAGVGEELLSIENGKLKMMLKHKDEMIERLKSETEALKELVVLLKKSSEK